MYNVYHLYDVDGGIGDAVYQKDLLFTTDSKEIADTFVSKYDNSHVYAIPYAKLYQGALRVEEISIIDNYGDIPQEIIQWGEENIKSTDVEDDYYESANDSEDADSEDDPLDGCSSFAEVQQGLEYPNLESYSELLLALRSVPWHFEPWHYYHPSYYSLEDIVADIMEVGSRVKHSGYSDVGEQRERLPHKGVLDGGMIGEYAVECKFRYHDLLFRIATNIDRVTVGFYPADSGNLTPFADEVWCIFYSEEDRPRRQRIIRRGS